MHCQLRSLLLVAATLLLSSLAFAQTSDYDRRPRTASISGRVTKDGKPSANVTVTITEFPPGIREARIFSIGGREFVDRYSYQTNTDAEGRYQFEALPAGQYQVTPKAHAYLPASGAHGLDALVRVTLDEGEARGKVDFALVRGGVITGRVTDEDGRPQIGRTVRLMQSVGENEWREVQNVHGRAFETDDRGVYRIFGLRKGRYIARAGGENDAIRHAINGKRAQVTYYSDVVKQEEATVIEVAEGTEITSIDIKLRDPGTTYTASGRVINSETGKPLADVNVSCFPVENEADQSGNSVAGPTTDGDGYFTAIGLKPGKYKAKLSPPQEGGDYYGEGTYFEVSDGDVSGLEVLARRGAVINGVVTFEESGGDASAQTPLSQLRLSAQVYKEYFVGTIRSQRMAGWLHSKIGHNGEFRLTGAPQGRMTIQVTGDSSTAIHLLRIELDGIEVRDGLEIGSGEKVIGLRVIVSQGTGSIRGSVKVIGGTLPEGVQLSVQVVRESPEPTGGVAHREGPVRTGGAAGVDEKGRFFIKGLLMGEYDLIISWGSGNYAQLDPNLRIPQPPKQRIRVTNGAETEVSLTIDLSRKEQEKQ
ncbi:MAG: carboxypeptidase-like regulatory domain-containing protein [Acidobacteriota bacterium]